MNPIDKLILIDRINSLIVFTEVFVRDHMEEHKQEPELINLSNKSIYLLEELKSKLQ